MRFLCSLRFLFFSLFLLSASASLHASSASSSNAVSGSDSSKFVRHQFISRSIGLLEAVEDYSIIAGGRHIRSAADEGWTHHWQKHQYLHAMKSGSFDEENFLPLIDEQAKTNNDHRHSMSVKNVNGASDNASTNINTPRFRAEGPNWIEPFPASISLSFRVFGADYHYDLKLDRELFSEDAAIVIDGKNKYKHMRATYTAGQEEVGSMNDIYPSWVVVTLALDGRFNAVISKNGTVLQIDPATMHINDIETGTEHHSRVNDEKYNPHQLLAFYLKDRTLLPPSTVMRPQTSNINDTDTANSNANAPSAPIVSDPPSPIMAVDPPTDSSSSATGSSSSSVSGSGAGRRLLMSRWTNCFPNDSQRRRLRFGVAMAFGHYNAIGGTPVQASNWISSVVADVNKVFTSQINIELVVGDTEIRTQSDGDYWNNSPCSSVLESFTNWRRDTKGSTASPMGLWHLFGGCTRGGGVAWLSNLCLNTGSGLTNYFRGAFWEIVAHELGHNFGANHPFDGDAKNGVNNQGKYGGIMDYGDLRIRGTDDEFASQWEVAFASTKNSNAKTVKEEICQHVSEALVGKNIVWAGASRITLDRCWEPLPTLPPPTTTTTTTTPRPTTRTTTTTTTSRPATQFGIYWKSHADRVVDVDNAINAHGTALKFWTPNGANGGPGVAQLFEWINGDQLRWVGTDKCLDVFQGKDENGTDIKLWTCKDGHSNQRFVKIGDQIQWKGRTGTGSNKCFDVTDGQYNPAGAILQINTCDANNQNQLFLLK